MRELKGSIKNIMVADNTLYQEQYCEKHNQRYGAHLHRCPICWGEELGQVQHEHIDLTKEKKSMEDKGV